MMIRAILNKIFGKKAVELQRKMSPVPFAPTFPVGPESIFWRGYWDGSYKSPELREKERQLGELIRTSVWMYTTGTYTLTQFMDVYGVDPRAFPDRYTINEQTNMIDIK